MKYTLLYLLWGYGEKLSRVLSAIAVGILLFAVLFAFTDPTKGFSFYIFYSVVCFTLGYGGWGTMVVTDLVHILAILESIIGVPMTGSFLALWTRKITR